MKALMLLAVMALGCGGSMGSAHSGLILEPEPDQVLLEETILSGPICLETDNRESGHEVTLTLYSNDVRLEEWTIKHGLDTRCTDDTPAGVLKVTAPAGAGPLTVTFF